MLSGGRDSFLSACYLLDDPKHYNVMMVTYDNGCSCQSGNAKIVADRIIARYGSERAQYLGVYNINSTIREFYFPYFNMKASEQAEKYPGLTPSQFHCLICRTSMYINSIWLAQLNNAKYIAEGGRRDQEFVIELPGMARDRFPKLVDSVGMELLLPVYDLDDDLIRDIELMHRGYHSKSLEPKCLIGVPVRGSIDEIVISSVHSYYDNEVLRIIRERELLSEAKARNYLYIKYDELTK